MRPRNLVVAVAVTAMLVSCADGPEPVAPAPGKSPSSVGIARALAPASGDAVLSISVASTSVWEMRTSTRRPANAGSSE